MKRIEPRILVAAAQTEAAETVRERLSGKFPNTRVSTDPDHARKDFARHQPHVLVLAFSDLRQAEAYYADLYRLGMKTHGICHRTVLLCGRDDLRRAYELCKREKFDDYVLYWPAPDDPSRIVLTVQQQLRNSVLQPPRPALSAAVAVPARRMAAVERKIFDIAADGIRQVEAAESALSRARDVVAGLLESPGCWLTAGDPGEIADVRERMTAPQHRLTDLHETKIEPALRAASEALDPLRLWVHSLSNALVPQMESTLRLAALAEDARPLVMIVDDDELQRRLLAQVLIEERLELIHAATGIEALRLLGKRRPDLIIMDIDLPEIDGIEVTRRIKALGRFASVPVLMLTGHVEPQLFVDSLQAGASDFVLKPFDGTAIRAAVARLLVNPASEAALASSP